MPEPTPPPTTMNCAVPRLRQSEDGRMLLCRDDAEIAVRVSTCFPWSAPGKFISLRDADNREAALIADPETLDPESRAALDRGLREATFAFEIARVDRLRLDYEIRHWEVTCVHGKRSFQTRKDDWPLYLNPNGLLITDIVGDVYTIDDWTALDRHSRKELSLYID